MHNNCPRYLIFFQYIGTKYRGVVKVPPGQTEVRGVQDYLEDALMKMKPVTPPRVYVSSRTDAGVHALSNSAHLDLRRRDGKPPFSEDVLVAALNHHLKNEDIRVTHVHRVAGDFHARFNALSRTYVYRLAQGVGHASLLPLSEQRLCWALCRHADLDVGAMREAAATLIGTHDFSSFMAINSDTPFKNPVKTLEVARVDPGTSFAGAHFHRDVPFWELTFRSRSFLYRQVRRMTGALVAVGQGQLSQDRFRQILEAKDSLGFPKNLSAPPSGLFLTRVEYSLTDLQFTTPHSSEGDSSSTERNQEGCQTSPIAENQEGLPDVPNSREPRGLTGRPQ